MSEVWIDIMTSKQVWFLGTFAQYLKDKGVDTWVTVRKYQENTEILERLVERGFFDFEYEITGVHGGQSREGKLETYFDRCRVLLDGAKKRDIGCGFSLQSPELARVAFGLGIPHVCTSDTPFAVAVSKLTFPFSNKLIISYLFDEWDFIRVGADPNTIIKYKGIDEIAWTRDYKPNPAVLDEIGLNRDTPIVIVRALSPHFTEFAHMFKDTETGVEGIISELLNKVGGRVQIVAIPRYGEQGPILRKKFGDKIKVVDHTEGPSLSSYASVLISAGGTMTREAALLGTYAISMDPLCKELVGEKFLSEKGLMTTTLDPNEAVEKVKVIVEDKQERIDIKNKAKKLREELEDPIHVFHKELKDYLT